MVVLGSGAGGEFSGLSLLRAGCHSSEWGSHSEMGKSESKEQVGKVKMSRTCLNAWLASEQFYPISNVFN